jgi:hypothetical protein
VRNVYREARIILPATADAAGIAAIEQRLVHLFGGFTRSLGAGAWRDQDGSVVSEDVLIYDVATAAFTAAADASGVLSHESERAWLGASTHLRAIARDACNAFRQECVYLRTPDGEVHLIGPSGRDYNPDTATPVYRHAAAFWHRRDT